MCCTECRIFADWISYICIFYAGVLILTGALMLCRQLFFKMIALACAWFYYSAIVYFLYLGPYMFRRFGQCDSWIVYLKMIFGITTN